VVNFAKTKSKSMTTFQNKKIIVAGGGSGIGKSVARQFAAKQAFVTITGRNNDKLKVAADEGFGTARVDSADRKSLDDFFQNFGNFDHLVITLSGGKGAGDFTGLSLQALREGFDEKFWPQLNTCQAALPYLNNGGSITMVTAISATAKLPGTSGLGAINGALESMVPVLAKELPQFRINAVAPGVVDTGWWDFLPPDVKQNTFKQFAMQTLVGRVAQPDEIADAILFVAGNGYMTGKIIGIDGGLF
jgi:NAD(P)-dependent dehydrogenase (short-subunit alcohol dehydrogenase family)